MKIYYHLAVRPMAIHPKMPSIPLLQKLILPPNNRLYKQKTIEWERKCRDMRRPLVILPKKNELEQLAQQKQGGETKLPDNKATDNVSKKPEPLKKEEEKRISQDSKASKESRNSRISRNSRASKISAIQEENEEVNTDDEEFEGEEENLSDDGYEETIIEVDRKRQTESQFQMHQSNFFSRLELNFLYSFYIQINKRHLMRGRV